MRLTKVIVAVDAQLGDPASSTSRSTVRAATTRPRTTPVDGDSIAIDVPNGAVDLSESAGSATSLADYTSSYRCVNTAEGSEDEPVTGEGTTITNLVVAEGDEWHCTFTNTRKKGTVKLVKHIVPVATQLGDPGKFDLAIDGEGAYDGSKDEAGNGDSVTVTVPNGLVDLSETADDETNLGDYLSSYRCEADGHDPITGEGTLDQRPAGHRGRRVDLHLHQHAQAGRGEAGQGHRAGRRAARRPGQVRPQHRRRGQQRRLQGTRPATAIPSPSTFRTASSTCPRQRTARPASSDYTSSYTLRRRRPRPGHRRRHVDRRPARHRRGRLDLHLHQHPQEGHGDGRQAAQPDERQRSVRPLDRRTAELRRDRRGPRPRRVGRRSRFRPAPPRLRKPAGTGTTLGAYISSYRCENVAQGEDQPVSGNGTAVQGISVTTGDDWVCTFTNVRKPRVVVKKLTEPAGDDATTFAFTSDLPATAAAEGSQAIGENGSFTLQARPAGRHARRARHATR